MGSFTRSVAVVGLVGLTGSSSTVGGDVRTPSGATGVSGGNGWVPTPSVRGVGVLALGGGPRALVILAMVKYTRSIC